MTIYANIDRLQTHLSEMFPAEKKVVNEFIGAIRSVLAVDPPFATQQGLRAISESLASIGTSIKSAPALIKTSKLSIREFSEKAKDPYLKAVFQNIAHFGGLDVPLLTILLPLAYAHRKMAGIPAKGWLAFAKAIERRYLELGGVIFYRTRVESLVADGGAVKGIRLADGSIQAGDIVLSAADGCFSNYSLTGRKMETKKTRYCPELISDQPMQVNLGVSMDISTDDGPTTYLLEKPFSAGGKTHIKLTAHNKYYDPDAAPEGKSAVTVFLDSSYEWWKEISNDTGRYKKEKREAAEKVIDAIEIHHPGFKANVEVIDVSTPLTRERYTGNWLGAMQAFRPDANILGAMLNGRPQYAFKGIKGYYMCGQWVEAWGGITTAAQSARKAVAAICKDERKRFITTVP